MTKCQICGGPLDERAAVDDCKFCMKDVGDPEYQDVGERPELKQIRDFDFGGTISEETKQALKDIDKNTQYAIMNAHKMWCD